MLGFLLGYVLIFLVPILVFQKNFKALTFLILWTIMSNWVFLAIGSYKVEIDIYIAFWVILVNFSWFARNGTPTGKLLLAEYAWTIFIGFFFLLFLPWADPMRADRTWTQSLEGKTITNTYRITEPIFIFYFFYYIISTEKISVKFLVQCISVLIIIQFGIGLHDVLNPVFTIKSLFHYEQREVLAERFTGMFTEPKHFGKMLSFAFFLVLTLQKYLIEIKQPLSKNLFRLTILCGFLGIMLSLSFSAIFILMVCGLIYMLYAKVKLINIFFSVVAFGAFLSVLLSSELANQMFNQRLANILVESAQNIIPGVPEWISGLEVFDAAGAAFFYKNPIHIIWGVGPNTIAIPATSYMSDYVIYLHDGVLHSPPGLFLLYFLSRSGIIGVSLFVFMIYQLTKKAQKSSKFLKQSLIILLVPFWFACNTSYLLYVLVGIMAGNIKNAEFRKS